MQLSAFVVGNGVEALDLLAVVFARVLNRVAQRGRGVAQLCDLIGRARNGTLDSRPPFVASFF